MSVNEIREQGSLLIRMNALEIVKTKVSAETQTKSLVNGRTAI